MSGFWIVLQDRKNALLYKWIHTIQRPWKNQKRTSQKTDACSFTAAKLVMGTGFIYYAL